jgi:hypothetical protein
LEDCFYANAALKNYNTESVFNIGRGKDASAPPNNERTATMTDKKNRHIALLFIFLSLATIASGGPYTETGINGYIGDDFRHAQPDDPDARVNPMFRGWATGFKDYLPSDDDWYGMGLWDDPNKALGTATGNVMDVVSLGDLDEQEIADGCSSGQITLIFGDPCNPNDTYHIRDVNGYDFVVFENGFALDYTDPFFGIVTGKVFAELAYVEVSSNGIDFARFPSVSLTPGLLDYYDTMDITNVYNLAGKHPNGYGWCIGTPFDLCDIINEPNVVSGKVDINNISHVRIVDIPGSGDFFDQAKDAGFIDPYSWPNWNCYSNNHSIYDPWVTEGSGGFDLEAIGILNEQQYSADINLDGIVDIYDLAIFVSAWQSHFGSSNWCGRCDLAKPKNSFIDFADFAVFASQWLKTEKWRNP